MSSNDSRMILILWTCATIEEARKICFALIEKKIVACANLIPHVESVYLWEKKLEHSHEVKVFLKTLNPLFETVRDYIKANCTYDVPEVSKICIEDGNLDYIQWVQETVSQPDPILNN